MSESPSIEVGTPLGQLCLAPLYIGGLMALFTFGIFWVLCMPKK